ncbi:MAG: M23 family metallopeptidase, partial [Candidatus Heimdallarchaeota archaeon]|nr:M23 family metallopeptidase [Candidatus Heimdallarchaeota archaeon]
GIPNNSWLIIPGGEAEVVDWGPPAITRDNPAVAAYYGPGSCGAVYDGAYGSGVFIWPTDSRWLSGYDWNPPIHKAIDIGGSSGDPIYASDSGVVVHSGNSNNGYGNLIVIDHGYGWQTAYAHLAFVSVPCGQSVWRGDTIGGMGTTGNSSGVHLHFEMYNALYGGKVNPWLFLLD